jgi:hypothetical protein
MELLCIESHPKGCVIAGRCYPLIRTSSNQIDSCDCTKDCVDVGIESDDPYFWQGTNKIAPFGTEGSCSECGKIFLISKTWWLDKNRFAQIATEDEVKEAEQTKELIET